MATIAGKPLTRPITPDATERFLGVASLVLLAVVIAAVLRGRAGWAELPLLVWLHLGLIGVALAVTPLLMLRRRGDRWHRRLGWVWSVAMFATAVISFGIRDANDGGLSFIHILSAVVVISVPLLILNARRHKVENHRRTVRFLIIGALLVAGIFTFPAGRLLGNWLLG